MKGLLYKDLLSLRQFRAMAFIIAAGLFSSIYSGKVDMFASICVILTATIPISLLGLEEKARWNTVALTLPVSRFTLVGEKYLFGLCTLLVGAGLVVLVGNGLLAVSGLLLWLLPLIAAMLWGLSLLLSVRLMNQVDL